MASIPKSKWHKRKERPDRSTTTEIWPTELIVTLSMSESASDTLVRGEATKKKLEYDNNGHTDFLVIIIELLMFLNSA